MAAIHELKSKNPPVATNVVLSSLLPIMIIEAPVRKSIPLVFVGWVKPGLTEHEIIPRAFRFF